jgi:DNA-directed RNA polymerase subunit omega
MARITVEDCLKEVDNRFQLIHLAAKRVRQLRKGAEPLVDSKNRDLVVALREIAAGEVSPAEENEEENYLIEKKADSDLKELPEQASEESPSEEKVDQEAVPEEE